jgi:hypothetical protein
VSRGKCDTCRHYRPALDRNAPAQALHWITQSGEPEVYEELKRIAAEEHERGKGENERVAENRRSAIDLINDFLQEREWPEGQQVDFWKPPTLSAEDVDVFNRELKRRLPLLFVREPHTVSHCAVHGERGVYYIPDLKNWADTCDDYERRTAVPNCRKCACYSKSATEGLKRAQSAALVTAIGSSDESAASVLERGASQIEAGIGPAKAHDLKTAYDARGRLLRPLSYLPYCEAPCSVCSAQGSTTSCVVCNGEGVQRSQPELFNRFLGCQAFKPIEATPKPEPVAPVHGPRLEAAPAQPVAAPRATVVGELGLSPFSQPPSSNGPGGLGLVQSLATQAVGFVFDQVRQARTAAASAAQRDPAEIPAPQIMVLVPGTPPLTNEMLRRSLAVASSLYDGGMPSAAQQEYVATVDDVWRRVLTDGIRLQLALVRLYDDDRSRPTWRHEAAELYRQLLAHRDPAVATGAAGTPLRPEATDGSRETARQ